ncbi:MAG: type I glyceraldehyde-3-phosphate dehydrogenase [Myxococcales bacterium]|nr:type I glyceraldehyde-3-phosphate dehydrogenase [Myxococcales bacterium]
MTIKVGINGFGRIGRCFFRIAWANPNIEIVGVNDLTDDLTLAHLLKYDSIHRTFGPDVSYSDGYLVVGGKRVRVFTERDPEKLPWGELGASIVLESTGVFRTADKCAKHLNAGAKKVVLSAPGKGDGIFTTVLGVNEGEYDPATHHVISNASCTTNCAAPLAKVLHESFEIEHGLLTTIHSYTNDQRILDLPHDDLRRARAAAMSMIPTTTGAAKAVGLVMPVLKGKLDGIAVRVPTPNVSLVDLVVNVNKPASVDQVNAAMKAASESGPLAGYLEYCDAELVSSDFIGNSSSSIFEPRQTMVRGNMIKVLSWYDNEWGYSSRLVDLFSFIGGRL